MPPAPNARSPPQQRSLSPQAAPAPVGLAPLDAPHCVVVGREAPERVELEGAVGLAHALQQRLGEQVPDGHGACGTRPAAVRSCPAAVPVRRGMPGAAGPGAAGRAGAAAAARQRLSQGRGLEQDRLARVQQVLKGAADHPKPDTNKSDRWGSSQSRVLEPTGT